MPAAAIYSTGRERFQKTLDTYLTLNKRNCRELIAKKAKSFTIEAYKATKAAAPTPGKIKQNVLALGWRVKRKAGAWPLKKGEKRGSRGPLNRMRAAVIRRRQRAIGSVAAGLIPAMNALGAAPTSKDASTFQHPLGRLDILTGSDTTPGLCVVNGQPGCAAVEKKHGIVDAALAKIEADMQTYIARKQEEIARAVQS